MLLPLPCIVSVCLFYFLYSRVPSCRFLFLYFCTAAVIILQTFFWLVSRTDTALSSNSFNLGKECPWYVKLDKKSSPLLILFQSRFRMQGPRITGNPGHVVAINIGGSLSKFQNLKYIVKIILLWTWISMRKLCTNHRASVLPQKRLEITQTLAGVPNIPLIQWTAQEECSKIIYPAKGRPTTVSRQWIPVRLDLADVSSARLC